MRIIHTFGSPAEATRFEDWIADETARCDGGRAPADFPGEYAPTGTFEKTGGGAAELRRRHWSGFAGPAPP